MTKIAALVASGIAITALSTVPASAADQSAASDSSATTKVICKNLQQTGSRFAKKTCRTKSEWDAMAEAARRRGEEMFNRPRVNLASGQ